MSLVNYYLSPIAAGFIAVLIGFASSAALIYQTVLTLGGDASLAAGWLLTLGLSMGVTSIGLSLYYRIPLLIAWSTPGAALLISTGQGFTLNQAAAGFICSALLIFICGISGLFEKLITKLPFHLASALLAGILLNFGIDVFNQMNAQPLLVAVMFITYLLARQLFAKFAMILVLIISILFAWQAQWLSSADLNWQSAAFSYTSPEFSFEVLLNIGLPLFIVTMAAQNLPGIAVLKAHNYPAPVSSILTVTGLTNLLTAPFGGYALNLAAITAAVCMTEDIDKDPGQRYRAAAAAGLFYIIMGLSAGYLMVIFAGLPDALIYALAGIALFGTIKQSILQALSSADSRCEASIITFLVTASNLTLWGLNSVLWGLLAGCLIMLIQRTTSASPGILKSLIFKIRF
ncbi:benzoate/H(+) symporter BenE family transporter [Psychromonas aquimarina]|uniref:benzoate/H(+) symporter BenE family transporter n=1 Tax=Psychromonas aquimarina TaxID=444919 RepID=UPI0003FC44EA|nr:benzoate/H(+) symporter BenE family transporter [Psychromonas aquimarina]